jgi:hypothetical protein
LGGILCGLQPFGNISFHFAILISGFASRAECHEHLMQPNAIKNVSSLHIYGINDILISNDRTLKLAAAFENPLVVSHPGGHFTPNTWPTATIKQFLIEQQECLSNKQDITGNTDINQFQSLAAFAEKIEATILFHQKRMSTLPATERKPTEILVIPIGLSKPIDEDNLDDAMLLVWCKRTTFHNTEAKDDSTTSLFARHWILLYLKKPDEVLSSHLSTIPKYGGWGDLKTIYANAVQMENEFPTDKILLENLKSACVKMFGDQLKRDQKIVLNQPDESPNEKEEEMAIKNQEWISNCAKEAPRISNTPRNLNTSKFLTHLISSMIFYL